MISASLRKFAALVVVVAPLFVANTSPVLAQATITVSAPNCIRFDIGGTESNRTLTCVPTTTTPTTPGAPGVPTGCVASISASPPTSAGGAVTLSVSGCSVSGAGVTYWWNKNGVPWNSGNPLSETLPANPLTTAVTTTYQVYVCNLSECAGFAPVTATVPGTGGTGGVIGGTACPGFSKTMFYNWNWASGVLNINTSLDAQGPIGPNGVVVVAFTVPPTAPFGGLGSVQVSPYPGDLQSTTRTTSISTTPCDFTPQADPTFVRSGHDAGTGFVIGAYPRAGMFAPLVAGRQYYINITSRDAEGNSTCQGSGRACDIRFTATAP